MADVRLAQVDEHPFGISWVIDEPAARASHALKVDGRVYIIDPVEHPAALERIEVLGPVAAVVQLLDRHNRDCAAIAEKLGVAHLRDARAIPNTPLQAIRVVDTAALARGRAVVAAPRRPRRARGARDLVDLDRGPRRRRPAPDPPPAAAEGAARYRPAYLLTGHGPPVEGPDARDGVEWAYDRAREDIPRLGAMLGRMAIDAVRHR